MNGTRAAAALALVTASLVLADGSAYGATTLVVGPGHPYAKPCQAIAAAGPGDTVEIDAAGNGGYDGDTCTSSTSGLTIEGINGRAHVDATGSSLSGGKAIWVLSGANDVVSNVELSGASNVDQNGAGIRVEGGGDLTLTGSYIHDNQDGILTSDGATSDIVVDSSQFASNGDGSGLSHNLYVTHVHSFTMRYSWSHDAVGGHLVKSRADTNEILYNRLTGQAGTSSYELDLPNGGQSDVIGNLIEQGASTQNSTMLSYGEEDGTFANASQQLNAVANTFVNDRPAGGTAIAVAPAVPTPALVSDNISVGATTFVSQTGAAPTLTGNCQPTDARFVDRAAFDYHLQSDSSCRDAGTAPPAALTPTQQYVYDLSHEPRTVVGSAPDAGAFEFGLPQQSGSGGTGGTDQQGGSQDTSAPTALVGTGAPQLQPGSVRVSKQSVLSNGSIQYDVVVSGPGSLTGAATTTVTARRAPAGAARRKKRIVTYAKGGATARGAGKVRLLLKPTAAGKRALKRAKRLKLAVAIRFTPTGGSAVAGSAKVTIKRVGSKVKGR